MSESAIRVLLKTILESVADIGKVYDYERYTNTEAGARALFKTEISGQEQYRAWMISRRSASEQPKTTASPNVYVIRGFLGVSDAASTEKTMTLLVEAIRDAFRDDATMYNAGYAHEPVQVSMQDKRMFGQLLCEHAELSITVYDFKTS